jgi:hypothetical protein
MAVSENAMAPCPPDSPLMKAWESYQATDDFKNSYKWATAPIEYMVLPEPADHTANRFTEENYRQAVQGSLWAAFAQGWKLAGGADPFKPMDTK